MGAIASWARSWWVTIRQPRDIKRWLASDFYPADFEDIDRPSGSA